MSDTTRLPSARPFALILTAAMACSGALAAADKSARAEGEKYRQACLAGQTHQDRATCLKEANNYLADLKRTPAEFQASPDIQANAKARCEPLSGSDRTACIARANGQGKVSGSVEGGGIYRELVTIESMEPVQGADTAPPAAAADSPATQ